MKSHAEPPTVRAPSRDTYLGIVRVWRCRWTGSPPRLSGQRLGNGRKDLQRTVRRGSADDVPELSDLTGNRELNTSAGQRVMEFDEHGHGTDVDEG